MNSKIKPHDTEPNKAYIDLHEQIINALYDKCGISLDHDPKSTMEESDNQD